MSDELDWNFVDKDDAKAEIRAAVEYLLRGTTGGVRGDVVQEILAIVRDAANGQPGGPIRWTMTCPAASWRVQTRGAVLPVEMISLVSARPVGQPE
jgi:hypothetical protein